MATRACWARAGSAPTGPARRDAQAGADLARAGLGGRGQQRRRPAAGAAGISSLRHAHTTALIGEFRAKWLVSTVVGDWCTVGRRQPCLLPLVRWRIILAPWSSISAA